jgi:hypothetical protein
MQTLKLLWFENELRILTRNTIIDVLVKKSERADRRWAWVNWICCLGPRPR